MEITSDIKYTLLKTVQENNILPLTSICNMKCIFCSHRNNPPGLQVYRLGHLQPVLIKELMDYLPQEGALIIGESATRIIEGEPMGHPYFCEIIKMIRSKFSDKLVKITTNGSYLTREIIEFLEKYRPFEFNISINCSRPEERVFLMGDKNPERVFKGLDLLKRKKFPVGGSIVAMPHLTGWDSLSRTIDRLIKSNVETIRVFMPGYTKWIDDDLKFSRGEMYNKLKQLVEEYENEEIPVLLEPPVIEDLKCRVKGIITGSPAENSSITKGDIITRVDGKKVLSRVDGFNRIKNAANPRIEYQHAGNSRNITLEKSAGKRPGIVVDYDIQPSRIEDIYGILERNKNDNICIITSVLSEKLIKQILKGMDKNITENKIDIQVIENKFFGGSICCTGLLVNEDIIAVLSNSKKNYDLILLPGIIYDFFGNDLTGKNYKEIEEKLKVTVEII